jgi:hypothetical protein
MPIGNGKLIEDVRTVQVQMPVSTTAAATLFNGAAAGAASGIDGSTFEEIVIVLNVGTVTGNGTLDVILMESTTDSAAAATAVAGASFTQITSANHQNLYVGSALNKYLSRYLFVRTVKGGTGSVDFAITAEESRFTNVPVSQSNTVAFDIQV